MVVDQGGVPGATPTPQPRMFLSLMQLFLNNWFVLEQSIL